MSEDDRAAGPPRDTDGSGARAAPETLADAASNAYRMAQILGAPPEAAHTLRTRSEPRG